MNRPSSSDGPASGVGDESAGAAPSRPPRRFRWRRLMINIVIVALLALTLTHPRETAVVANQVSRTLVWSDRTWLDSRIQIDLQSRAKAVVRAYDVAGSPWQTVSFTVQAAWSPSAVSTTFDRLPVAVIASDADRLLDMVTTAVSEAALAAGVGLTASWTCLYAGELIVPGLGQLASPFCWNAAVAQTADWRRRVHFELFGRPMDEDARLVGALVGTVAGMHATLRLVETAQFRGYGDYEKVARNLTEKTMRASGSRIDPKGLRGIGYHLDHAVPVRCGYSLLIPPEIIASSANLRILTAQANLAIGSRGCRG